MTVPLGEAAGHYFIKQKNHAKKYMAFFVPETGFEPAHPFGRHHLKVVRLPISPPGQVCLTFFQTDCKYSRLIETIKQVISSARCGKWCPCPVRIALQIFRLYDTAK